MEKSLTGTTEGLINEGVLPPVSCEEFTRAINEIESADLHVLFQLLRRICDAIVVWEATLDLFDFVKVFASVRLSADTPYS